MGDIIKIRCSIMRGGTSKAVFFLENDLPSDPAKREKVILAAYGSPDKRQIDGLGGADPLTSKCGVVGPSARADADVEYSYYRVGIESGYIGAGICGNVSAAVAPFAIDAGLVKVTEPLTTVRIYNTSRQRVFTAEVPVSNGKVVVEGDYEIAGVPGTGAKIKLDWKNIVGIESGALLPTGHVVDRISVPGIGDIDASFVDSGNPVAFIRAADVGLKGTESAAEVDANKTLLDKLEEIRGIAGEIMGLMKDRNKSRTQNRNHPLLAFVSPAVDYTTYAGKQIHADDYDFSSRIMYLQIMHKTYPGSGTLCTGTTALIEGTVVNQLMKKDSLNKKRVRIGHPGGIIEPESDVEKIGDKFVVKKSVFYRTARKIMDGEVHIRRKLIE